jgi:hypothetical protein
MWSNGSHRMRRHGEVLRRSEKVLSKIKAKRPAHLDGRKLLYVPTSMTYCRRRRTEKRSAPVPGRRALACLHIPPGLTSHWRPAAASGPSARPGTYTPRAHVLRPPPSIAFTCRTQRRPVRRHAPSWSSAPRRAFCQRTASQRRVGDSVGTTRLPGSCRPSAWWYTNTWTRGRAGDTSRGTPARKEFSGSLGRARRRGHVGGSAPPCASVPGSASFSLQPSQSTGSTVQTTFSFVFCL